MQTFFNSQFKLPNLRGQEINIKSIDRAVLQSLPLLSAIQHDQITPRVLDTAISTDYRMSEIELRKSLVSPDSVKYMREIDRLDSTQMDQRYQSYRQPSLNQVSLQDTKLQDLRLNSGFENLVTSRKNLHQITEKPTKLPVEYKSKDPNNRVNLPYYQKIAKIRNNVLIQKPQIFMSVQNREDATLTTNKSVSVLPLLQSPRIYQQISRTTLSIEETTAAKYQQLRETPVRSPSMARLPMLRRALDTSPSVQSLEDLVIQTKDFEDREEMIDRVGFLKLIEQWAECQIKEVLSLLDSAEETLLQMKDNFSPQPGIPIGESSILKTPTIKRVTRLSTEHNLKVHNVVNFQESLEPIRLTPAVKKNSSIGVNQSQMSDDKSSKSSVISSQSSEQPQRVNDLLSPLDLIPRSFRQYRNEDQDGINFRKRLAPVSRTAEDDCLTPTGVREERDQKLSSIQDKLHDKAAEISVNQALRIKTEDYPHFFRCKIYESFKPTNLELTRNYIDYLIYNSNADHFNKPFLPQFPKDININQKQILVFDSNFESGNLDSAYLENLDRYNLLLKVDTNTKGHMHWFYFKVQNWYPGQVCTFTILNLVRDLSSFYGKGMNIQTRYEVIGGKRSEWRADPAFTQIDEIERSNDIVRSRRSDGELTYYSSLKFKCTFPTLEALEEMCPGENYRNIEFSYAYALPYVYSDLLGDLDEAKKALMAAGGKLTRHFANQGSTFNVTNTKNEFKAADSKSRMRLLEQQALKDKAINQQNLSKDEQIHIKAHGSGVIEERAKLVSEVRDSYSFSIQTDQLYYQQDVISRSICGLNIYMLTFTMNRGPKCIPFHKKKYIYLQARMHAAETPGSWVMSEIIRQLSQEPDKYEKILSKYVIKLIPMINPDGVTIGNSRSSVVGVDLNRRWANPHCIAHPEIYFLKEMMMDHVGNKNGGISIFCDFHGHNKKENCFFYGCSKASDEGLVSWTKTRLLPKIFAKNEKIFEYKYCRFQQDRSKLSTARVVVWNEMKVTNSFTLEISMYGKRFEQPLSGDEKLSQQFVTQDFNQIALSFLLTVSNYVEVEPQLEQWLKPIRLKEIAGESARSKAQKEAETQMHVAKKQARIQKNQRNNTCKSLYQQSSFHHKDKVDVTVTSMHSTRQVTTNKWTEVDKPTVGKKGTKKNLIKGDTSNNESDPEKFSLPKIAKLHLQNFLDLNEVAFDFKKDFDKASNDSDGLSDSCSSACQDEFEEREVNKMLSPVFDVEAGLMPVLFEASDESISSASLSHHSDDEVKLPPGIFPIVCENDLREESIEEIPHPIPEPAQTPKSSHKAPTMRIKANSVVEETKEEPKHSIIEDPKPNKILKSSQSNRQRLHPVVVVSPRRKQQDQQQAIQKLIVTSAGPPSGAQHSQNNNNNNSSRDYQFDQRQPKTIYQRQHVSSTNYHGYLSNQQQEKSQSQHNSGNKDEGFMIRGQGSLQVRSSQQRNRKQQQVRVFSIIPTPQQTLPQTSQIQHHSTVVASSANSQQRPTSLTEKTPTATKKKMQNTQQIIADTEFETPQNLGTKKLHSFALSNDHVSKHLEVLNAQKRDLEELNAKKRDNPSLKFDTRNLSQQDPPRTKLQYLPQTTFQQHVNQFPAPILIGKPPDLVIKSPITRQVTQAPMSETQRQQILSHGGRYQISHQNHVNPSLAQSQQVACKLPSFQVFSQVKMSNERPNNSRVPQASVLSPEHAKKFNLDYDLRNNTYQALMNGTSRNSAGVVRKGAAYQTYQ